MSGRRPVGYRMLRTTVVHCVLRTTVVHCVLPGFAVGNGSARASFIVCLRPGAGLLRPASVAWLGFGRPRRLVVQPLMVVGDAEAEDRYRASPQT